MVTVGEQRLMTMLERFCREQGKNNSFIELESIDIKSSSLIKIFIRISDISEVIFDGDGTVQINLSSGNKLTKISEEEYETKIKKYINIV